VNGTQGVYAGLGKCVGGGLCGFTMYRPDRWAFEGSYVRYGDVLGGGPTRFFGGTCEWMNELKDRDPQVVAVTRAVLDRFGRSG